MITVMGDKVKGFLGVLSHFTQQQYSNAVTTERGFQRKLFGVAASLVNFLSGRRLYILRAFFLILIRCCEVEALLTQAPSG